MDDNAKLRGQVKKTGSVGLTVTLFDKTFGGSAVHLTDVCWSDGPSAAAMPSDATGAPFTSPPLWTPQNAITPLTQVTSGGSAIEVGKPGTSKGTAFLLKVRSGDSSANGGALTAYRIKMCYEFRGPPSSPLGPASGPPLTPPSPWSLAGTTPHSSRAPTAAA